MRTDCAGRDDIREEVIPEKHSSNELLRNCEVMLTQVHASTIFMCLQIRKINIKNMLSLQHDYLCALV